MHSRFNAYQIMWIMVLFDMPTETKADRRNYTRFRKKLVKDGFTMFQFSSYIRHCMSRENMQVHMRRVKAALPPKGKIGILQITDKQFGMIQIFDGRDRIPERKVEQQLEMF